MNNSCLKNEPLRYILMILIVVSSFSALRSQTVGSVSLSDCINKARIYHPSYADRQKIQESLQLKLKNISSSWLPQLNLNGQATYQSESTEIPIKIQGLNISGTPLDQYKMTLDVNQVIYDGGAARAQKEVTAASVEADLQQNETDLYKTNEQVSNIYFYTLLLQINRDLYANTLEDLSSKEGKIASGVKNGILIESDLNNLKIEILKTKQQLNELELAYSNSRQILSRLTGDSTILDKKLLVPEFSVPTNDSIKRPELKSFDLQKMVMEDSKLISTAQRSPKVYAFSQLGYGRPGLNMLSDEFKAFYIVGLKLQWNIWDWGKASREKSIYSLQEDMIDSRKENYLRNLDINYRNEMTRSRQLESAIETDQQILALRKSVSLQSEKRLDQGLLTVSDYLTDYNGTVKAGLQLENHRIQLIQTRVNLMIINGIL